jgi:uroporphyrinogen-III decarboxylase
MTAMAHQQPDHVPLVFNPFGYRHVPPQFRGPHAWEDFAAARGFDAVLRIFVPWRLRDTTFRSWQERRPGEALPVICGEWENPKGRLRAEVRRTADWPWGETGLALFDDYNPPRAIKHPIESEQDLEVFAYMFDLPDEALLSEVRQRAEQTKREAESRGLVIEGHCLTGGDSLLWLCGADHSLYYMMDQPAFVHRLLEVIHRNEMRRLEMLLDLGVADIVVRRGWYEGLRLCSPRLYREFYAPLIREEAALVHQAGLPYMYICSTDIMRLLPIWKQLGLDIVWGVDPVQGDADLASLKRDAGDWLAFWGGMNAAVTLTQGTDQQIREAVETAVRTLGPGGGFVLLPVDTLCEDVPERAFDVLLEAWKACASY